MKNREKNKVQSSRNINIITDNTPFTIKEAYKSTRTNIILSVHNEGCKKIIITSAFPREGKTTTCVNIAITFAQTGARVLLLDADLRKPRLHRIFSLEKNIGLTNVLSGINDLSDVIVSTEYENLDLLPSGSIPPNPAEMLASDQMKSLLETLSNSYDYIFIDTPPVNVVTDAVVLSRQASGIYVVARQEFTDHKSLREAISKLEFVQSKPLGFILNDINEHSMHYKYKYNYKSKYKYSYSRHD